MKFPFIGRSQELSLLDQLWEAPGAQFLVLYGRRRIGKTALLSQWIERTGLKPVIDSEFALNEVHAALQRLASGRQFGKVALHLSED